MVRYGDLMEISNLIGKILKNVNQSTMPAHLWQCNCTINFDDFDILAGDSNKFRVLTKTRNNLKRPETTWNDLKRPTTSKKQPETTSQLAQWRCDNIVTTSLLALSQRCVTTENESCADVGFRRCDNVALRRYQDVATILLQRRHNIKHWISRPFYYRLFWFLSLHRNWESFKSAK